MRWVAWKLRPKTGIDAQTGVLRAVEAADRHAVGQLGQLHVELLGRLDLGEDRREDVHQRRIVPDPDEHHGRAGPDADVAVGVHLQLVDGGLRHGGDDRAHPLVQRHDLVGAVASAAESSPSASRSSRSSTSPMFGSLRAVASGRGLDRLVLLVVHEVDEEGRVRRAVDVAQGAGHDRWPG
jgi:hypothetical protein